MKRTYVLFIPAIILFTLISCSSRKKAVNTSIVNEGKVWASLYQQRAAEYRALCFQAYNIARQRVDEAVSRGSARPMAVVTDIDETLLDNSPYDAGRAIANKDYRADTWKKWTAKAVADTVPGAPAFFKYAASKGVEVFYVTNRDADEQAGTLQNLQHYGLPDVDAKHLVLKTASSSKESRRQAVLKDYNVVLLCGDNLADFDALYDNHPSEAQRTAATDRLRQQFGNRYIVIPNASYGDWESALFNQSHNLSTIQKDSIIRAKLKTDQ